MKGKSLAVTIMSALVLILGSYSGYFTDHVQSWLGIVSMGLVLTMSTFFPSGKMVSGFTPILVLSNVLSIVIQLLNATADKSLISPEVVNGVIIGINIFLTTFLKDYSGNGSIMERKLI